MGFFRWTGRQMAKPVTLRANAYRDIGRGVKSAKRAVMRGMPGKKLHSPPILSGVRSESVDVIYERWNVLSRNERATAWQEYQQAMPLLMQLAASEAGREWSLEMPGTRRETRYNEIQKSLRISLAIFSGMLLLPALFIISSGSSLIYWMNLLALAFLLAPNPMRLLILRAQLYHGGRVSPLKLFQRYPSELHVESGNTQEKADAAPTQAQQTLTHDFPVLSALYGIKDSPNTASVA